MHFTSGGMHGHSRATPIVTGVSQGVQKGFHFQNESCDCKGIGKELIQSVIKSEEKERIKAQTDDGSIGFYRKCGFMGGR